MIEITCTRKQKQTIINSLLNPEGCLWPRSQKSCALDFSRSCEDCFEKKIKWNLTDRKGRNKNCGEKM